MEAKSRFRNNGFSLPIGKYQMATWVIFFYDILVFIFQIILEFGTELRVVFASTYGILLILVAVHAFLVTYINPTDTVVISFRNSENDE